MKMLIQGKDRNLVMQAYLGNDDIHNGFYIDTIMKYSCLERIGDNECESSL
jgi:hypothetical protein